MYKGEKSVMKNVKRWIAFLLVIVLLSSTGIHQLSTSMRANEVETSEQEAGARI